MSYTWLAYKEGCVAQTSNNSVPMCSPLGGMGNTIAVPPLDAIGPGGEKPPVWMSTKLCEWYDADTAQAVLQGTLSRCSESLVETARVQDARQSRAAHRSGYNALAGPPAEEDLPRDDDGIPALHTREEL